MAPHSPATAAAVPGALNLVSLLHAAGNLAVQGLLRADVREDRSWDLDLAESEFEPSEAPGLDPEERAELEQVMGWRAEGPMPVALHSDDPTVLVVPSDATYEEVAAALAAEWTAPRTDWFRFVPEDRVPRAPDLEHRCVRIIRSSNLAGRLQGEVRTKLDAYLANDVHQVVDLVTRYRLRPYEQGRILLVSMVWADRSEWTDGNGRSYFDRYLDGLDAVRLTEPKWYTFTLTQESQSALQWAFEMLDSNAALLQRLIRERSTRHVALPERTLRARAG